MTDPVPPSETSNLPPSETPQEAPVVPSDFRDVSYVRGTTVKLPTVLPPGILDENGELAERADIEWVDTVMQKCMFPFTVLDVGSCLGSYSWLTGLHPRGEFMCFEPNAQVADAHEAILSLNKLPTHATRVFHVACGAERGTAELLVPAQPGLAVISPNPLRFPVETAAITRVVVVPLDVYIPVIHSPVLLLKIDVEGNEAGVIRGAKELIQRYHPLIQVELNAVNCQQCGEDPKWWEKLLVEELGYAPIRQNGENVWFAPKQ